MEPKATALFLRLIKTLTIVNQLVRFLGKLTFSPLLAHFIKKPPQIQNVPESCLVERTEKMSNQ